MEEYKKRDIEEARRLLGESRIDKNNYTNIDYTNIDLERGYQDYRLDRYFDNLRKMIK